MLEETETTQVGQYVPTMGLQMWMNASALCLIMFNTPGKDLEDTS